jgi:2-oxoglutarate dehydrogenase E1 component
VGATAKDIEDHLKILQLISAYQLKGHEIADYDPLKLNAEYRAFNLRGAKQPPPDLDYRYYGFKDSDLEREFTIATARPQGILAEKEKWKLGELLKTLREKYCQTLGLERAHITNSEESEWLLKKMEVEKEVPVTLKDRRDFFDSLQWTSLFEEFLQLKFTTTKRFSGSGSDSLLPCLRLVIDYAVEQGVEKIIIGMPHRGRINVLTNIVKKHLEEILAGFQGIIPRAQEPAWGNSGDVKYHLGCMYEFKTPAGKKIEIQLMPNPSHLESVDPVTAGRVRAEQDLIGDTDRKKVLGVLMHGDAAFAGQGIVYETLQFANLHNYNCGGTIHIVVNNQIGFTTVPRDSRPGLYCTEIAKSIGAPIFHVNGEDPDSVIKSCKIAAEYRQKFGRDIVIDLIGYRLYGHNEMDQPAFTQPLMYKKVHSMRRVYDKITEKYLAEGIVKKEEVEAKAAEIKKGFNEALAKAKNLKFSWDEWKPRVSNRMPLPFEGLKNTGIKADKLRAISDKLNFIPKDFAAHPLVRKVYEQRHKTVKDGVGIDWATGEALAWATLLEEGHNVRISGQDVQRGTFSHRHSYLHSQEKDEIYIPLRHVAEKQGKFVASNSSLSELAVLGFEVGYSYADPNNLVMWEGQFGDFANGAQLIIDGYIAAAEAKWGVQSGIVLLLPHGYDGQGAEHSSARLERYLQLCDDDPHSCRLPGHLNRDTNWQVVNCTTPGNYFHALRRQLRRDYRKPLVVMSPKRLLRLREAVSEISEFDEGKRFRVLIPDQNPNLVAPEAVEKIIFCSGQVYYDLAKARADLKKNKIAIIRLEQIAPFPVKSVQEQVNKYKNARVVWCQEEHFNMGAWSFVAPRANKVLFVS